MALDYGELDLGPQGRLLLYGLPGQARFRFMFEVVREGLLGIVVLVDALADGALAGLEQTLDCYADPMREVPCVLALNKDPDAPLELRRACRDALRKRDLVAPVIAVDARRREDCVRIFELLFQRIQYGGYLKAQTEAT